MKPWSRLVKLIDWLLDPSKPNKAHAKADPVSRLDLLIETTTAAILRRQRAMDEMLKETEARVAADGLHASAEDELYGTVFIVMEKKNRRAHENLIKMLEKRSRPGDLEMAKAIKGNSWWRGEVN